LSKNYQILIIGRILGGISTSLLQTAFESWLAAAANELGIPERELSKTFAKATFLNGVAAIASGVLSYWLVVWFGFVSPFLLSATLLILSYFMISKKWTEYYGKATLFKWRETIHLVLSGKFNVIRQLLYVPIIDSDLF
jgi:MFS family permease